jgi:hypothetical protein
MDARLKGFMQQNREGQLRDMELGDFQKAICSVQLIPTVPEEITTVFTGAKKLFVFGFFEYYFLSISLHYLFLSVESALCNKYKELFGEKAKSMSLKNVIRKLTKAGIIQQQDERIYQSTVSLRNEMSHLARPTIFPASQITFERVTVLINQLYVP